MAGIDVHGMDFSRFIQQVIQGVAAGAGDHNQSAIGLEVEHLPIQARVFPARVIDKVRAMHALEDSIVERVGRGGRRLG